MYFIAHFWIVYNGFQRRTSSVRVDKSNDLIGRQVNALQRSSTRYRHIVTCFDWAFEIRIEKKYSGYYLRFQRTFNTNWTPSSTLYKYAATVGVTDI